MDNKTKTHVKEIKKKSFVIKKEIPLQIPKKKYHSIHEKKVFDLLNDKHEVSQQRWSRLTKSAKNILAKFVEDKNNEFRSKAILGLVLSNHPSHVKILESILQDKKEDSFDKYVAVLSLGRSKNKKAHDLIINCLSDKDDYLRMRSTEVLAKIGNKKDIKLLESGLHDHSKLVRESAKNSINLLRFKYTTKGGL